MYVAHLISLFMLITVIQSKLPLFRDFMDIAEREDILFRTVKEMKTAFVNFKKAYRTIRTQNRSGKFRGFLTKLSSVDFYTRKQFRQTLGAVIQSGVKLKRYKSETSNKKRFSANIYSGSSVRYFDATRALHVNDAVNQGLCGNCYIHATIAAIEIAYTKATGKLKKFSEQELTDCYYRGCNGGDYRQVCKTLAVTNRISERDKYGDYLSMVKACRASSAPDALDVMQIEDAEEVTVDTVEAAVTIHGSVMTCMDWNHECAHIKNYGGGIFTGPVSSYCDHAVLIVGYTPKYYKVRNSHGKSWGIDGYLKIKRGNTCGIENNMAVLKVKTLDKAKDRMKSGCSRDKPMFCEESNTCTNKPCINFERDGAPVVTKEVPPCDDDPKAPCARFKSMCDKDNVKLRCWKTCDACEEFYASLTHTGSSTVPLLHSPVISAGPCNIPDIVNGHVITNKDQLDNGENVTITCDTGYTLTGSTVYCIVQDTFGPDSRLMPECIKLDDSALIGNGSDYIGSRITSVSGKPCLNWNKSVYKGEVVNTVEATKAFLVGNHRYCRNPGGMMLGPFCIVNTVGDMEYCFKYPGCNYCHSGVTDADRYCHESKSKKFCTFSTTGKSGQFYQAWTECLKTCCEVAGCPMTVTNDV